MKKWTVIDNGYRCKKDYKGFGWHIEANDTSEPFERWIIELGRNVEAKKMFDGITDIDKPFMKHIWWNNVYALGFNNLKDAKQWAEENAR